MSERPFKSSHTFERRFEQLVSTSLSSQVTLHDTNDVVVGLFKEHCLLLPEQGQFSATVVQCQHNCPLLYLAYIYTVFLPLSSIRVRKYNSMHKTLSSFFFRNISDFLIQENFAAHSFAHIYFLNSIICLYARTYIHILKLNLQFQKGNLKFSAYFLVMRTYLRTYCP